MAAEICPVCKGSGKIKDLGILAAKKTCHGCNGKGWIETGSVPMIPYVPPSEPYAPYPYYFGPWILR